MLLVVSAWMDLVVLRRELRPRKVEPAVRNLTAALLRPLQVLVVLALALAAPSRSHQDLVALDLSSYRGKVVYLDFWASWCGPCRDSFPFLEGLQRKYGGDGLVVVAVNVDTKRELAAKFLSEHPVSFDIAYDPHGELAARWQLAGMPNSFLIARDGSTRLEHTGFRRADQPRLEAVIVQLLAEGAP
jgi:thiol-disulfide isomerase/thioredoxin